MEIAAKIRNAVIHVDRDAVAHYGGIFPDSITFHNALTDKQVRNINKALGTAMDYREMLVVVDLTVFGSCKEAIVFTREGLYATGDYLSEKISRKSKLPLPLRYSDMKIPSVATIHDIDASAPNRFIRLRFSDGRKPLVYMGGYAPFVVFALRGILNALQEEQKPAAAPATKPAAPKPNPPRFEQPQPAVPVTEPPMPEQPQPAVKEAQKQPEQSPCKPVPKKTMSTVDTKVLLERGMAFFAQRNFKEAFPRLLAAAQAGRKEAWVLVGQMYFYGWGTEEDRPRALPWLVTANSYKEDIRCLNPIAQILASVQVNDEALKYAQRAYELNPDGNRKLLGKIYENIGLEMWDKQNTEQALAMLTKAVEYGNANAALAISIMYQGEGLKKDVASQVLWLKKAAELGEKKAFNQLGAMYYNGDELPADEYEAMRWFEEGAKRGEPSCNYNLAGIYLHKRRYYKAMDYAKVAKKLNAENIDRLIAEIRKHI